MITPDPNSSLFKLFCDMVVSSRGPHTGSQFSDLDQAIFPAYLRWYKMDCIPQRDYLNDTFLLMNEILENSR
jgi:hypothetical protein